MGFLNVKAKHSKEIWRLAFPIIMGTITVMVMNQTDRIMIGRWQESISGAALSASSQVQQYILQIVMILGSSMTIALQAIASRRKGEGNFRDAGETFQTAVSLSLILGLLATVVTVLFHKDIMLFLLGGQRGLMYELGTPYFFWRGFELFFVIAMFSYRGFFNGIGHPKVDMYFTILRVALNIILNTFLIYGTCGFPELGIEGAAIATLISTIVSFLGFTIYVFTNKYRHKYHYMHLVNPLKLTKIWRLIRLSIPGALQFAAMTGFLYFNLVIIKEYGQIMGGASSIMFAISNIMFMVILGLGIAGATLVGQSMGKGKLQLAEVYVYTITKIGMFIMLLFSVFVFAFPELILRIYTGSEEVISVGIVSLRIFVSTQVFNAAGLIISKCMQGAGAQKRVTVFEYIAQAWQVTVTTLLVFVFDAPFWLLWVGFASYQVVMVSLNFFYFRTRKWKQLKV